MSAMGGKLPLVTGPPPYAYAGTGATLLRRPLDAVTGKEVC